MWYDYYSVRKPTVAGNRRGTFFSRAASQPQLPSPARPQQLALDILLDIAHGSAEQNPRAATISSHQGSYRQPGISSLLFSQKVESPSSMHTLTASLTPDETSPWQFVRYSGILRGSPPGRQEQPESWIHTDM